MTEQDQIRDIAELDGWEYKHFPDMDGGSYGWVKGQMFPQDELPSQECSYLTSRDAIVGAILNLKSLDRAEFVNSLMQVLDIRDDQSPEPSEMFSFATATPNQLCEALLRAYRKWKV